MADRISGEICCDYDQYEFEASSENVNILLPNGGGVYVGSGRGAAVTRVMTPARATIRNFL
jgi:hypothetical protein